MTANELIYGLHCSTVPMLPVMMVPQGFPRRRPETYKFIFYEFYDVFLERVLTCKLYHKIDKGKKGLQYEFQNVL